MKIANERLRHAGRIHRRKCQALKHTVTSLPWWAYSQAMVAGNLDRNRADARDPFPPRAGRLAPSYRSGIYHIGEAALRNNVDLVEIQDSNR
jgi:hypothetical protein